MNIFYFCEKRRLRVELTDKNGKIMKIIGQS